MLKFGLAAWIFGLSTFIITILITKGPTPLFKASPIYLPIFAMGASVPVLITVVTIQKLRIKIRHLERVKRDLLSQYEKGLLKSL